MSEQSLDTWRETFDTNVFGLIATTNAFLPLLRKSEAGRIVNLSSILGSIEFHAKPGSPIYESKDTPAYNVSKSAVNAYHRAARPRVEGYEDQGERRAPRLGENGHGRGGRDDGNRRWGQDKRRAGHTRRGRA